MEVLVPIEWFERLLELKNKLNEPDFGGNANEASDYHFLMGYIDSAEHFIKERK